MKKWYVILILFLMLLVFAILYRDVDYSAEREITAVLAMVEEGYSYEKTGEVFLRWAKSQRVTKDGPLLEQSESVRYPMWRAVSKFSSDTKNFFKDRIDVPLNATIRIKYRILEFVVDNELCVPKVYLLKVEFLK